MNWFKYSFLLLLPGVLLSAAENNFYVSPTGSDGNPGTEAAPFATIDKARLAVRELKKSWKGDIIVGLKGGKYTLDKTVVFSAEDTGSATQSITYKAVGDEVAVLTSEKPVGEWTNVSALPPGMPSSAKGKLWSAPLPQGVGRIKYMFNGDKVLPRSMTKGFIPPVGVARKGKSPEERQFMQIPDGIISDWTDVKDMELVIMPVCDWTLYNMPLDSYDSQTHTVKAVSESPKYALGTLNKFPWEGVPSAWFANCPDGMREIGNWYVNTREKKVYLLSDQKPEDISVPTLFEFVKLEGASSSDPEGSNGLVENIHFKGLVFTKGKRRTMGGNPVTGASTNAREGSLLSLINTKNCSVEQCRFENSGNTAISLTQASHNNRIVRNNIKRLGGTGIAISGGRSGNGQGNGSSGNQIIGNQICHIGEADWSARGISISGSGNLIAHNLIHHTPYNGMSLGGSGGNVIEYNEMHHVMEVLGDGNALYIVTDQKNTVRYNYIHDMMNPHSSSAMRTDGVGTSKNITFHGNIMYNIINGGIALKGFGHKAINNIFVDSSGDTETWEGGRGWLEVRCGPSEGTSLKNNIFLATLNNQPKFMYAKIPMPERFRNKNLDIEVDKIDQGGNIWYSTIIDQSEENAAIEGIKKQGFELEFRESSAISIKDGRVVLNPNDELFKQGYEYIDMGKIGLPATFPRQWLKVDPEMVQKKYFKSND
ncbi:right-handed parallel beta-helix repeat-containing protein [Planctomycetota bacterium]